MLKVFQVSLFFLSELFLGILQHYSYSTSVNTVQISNSSHNSYLFCIGLSTTVFYSTFCSLHPPTSFGLLDQSSLFIPKSSYLLMKLEFPNFTKAASWDSISESYTNLTSKLVTGSKPKGKGAVFPYLMHLGLGVKYTECFEMQKSSHSMILHREQTMSQSRFKHYVFSRASRV